MTSSHLITKRVWVPCTNELMIAGAISCRSTERRSNPDGSLGHQHKVLCPAEFILRAPLCPLCQAELDHVDEHFECDGCEIWFEMNGEFGGCCGDGEVVSA